MTCETTLSRAARRSHLDLIGVPWEKYQSVCEGQRSREWKKIHFSNVFEEENGGDKAASIFYSFVDFLLDLSNEVLR